MALDDTVQLSRPFLVTGASGFVGEHVVRRLAADGIAVTGVWFQHEARVAGCASVQCDLRDRDAVAELVDRADPGAVIHCAAETRSAVCEKDPEGARRSILDATGNLLRALEERTAGAPFLALSTDLVFDGESAPYSEEDPAKPLMVYGSLKHQMEGLVLGSEQGCVVRSALVYGPRTLLKGSFLGWMRDTMERAERLELFEDERRSPIHVEDLSGALVTLVSRRQRGIWHAGGGDSLNRLEMGQVCCDVFGYPGDLLVARRLADSEYPAPRPRDVSLDSTKLESFLGRGFRSFRRGLEDIRRRER